MTRPSYLTGGISEGATCTTIAGQPLMTRDVTVIVGMGCTLPSFRQFATSRIVLSLIVRFAHRPSSSTPMKMTPWFAVIREVVSERANSF